MWILSLTLILFKSWEFLHSFSRYLVSSSFTCLFLCLFVCMSGFHLFVLYFSLRKEKKKWLRGNALLLPKSHYVLKLPIFPAQTRDQGLRYSQNDDQLLFLLSKAQTLPFLIMCSVKKINHLSFYSWLLTSILLLISASCMVSLNFNFNRLIDFSNLVATVLVLILWKNLMLIFVPNLSSYHRRPEMHYNYIGKGEYP